jgi:hypothetical protein
VQKRIKNINFTIIRSNICKTDVFMSHTVAKKHKLYSLYHNLFKLLCNWPEAIYKSRFIKISKIDTTRTTRSNAFASQKGRASFLLHLSIQKRNILIGLLFIKITCNTSQTDSNSLNGQIQSFSYLFVTFLPLTSDASHIFENPSQQTDVISN